MNVDTGEESANVDVDVEEPSASSAGVEEVAASEKEEMVLSIGDEEVASAQDQTAPAWVRDVRKQNRDLQKKIKELETQRPSEPATQNPVSARLKLEDFDYDEEKFAEAVTRQEREKQAGEARRLQAERLEQEQQAGWQATMGNYNQKKVALKVVDFEDAEFAAQGVLNDTQLGIILAGATDPAKVVYAIGKNPTRAKELAAIHDPLKFAVAMAILESQVKIEPRKPLPQPDASPPGSSGRVVGKNATLDALRAKAAKTGDFSEVVAYKRKLRDM